MSRSSKVCLGEQDITYGPFQTPPNLYPKEWLKLLNLVTPYIWPLFEPHWHLPYLGVLFRRQHLGDIIQQVDNMWRHINFQVRQCHLVVSVVVTYTAFHVQLTWLNDLQINNNHKLIWILQHNSLINNHRKFLYLKCFTSSIRFHL